MSLLLNPLVQWATHPADQGNIKFLDGLQDASHTLPQEGEIITRPFLVDPRSLQPVPVRVVEIHQILETRGHTLVVVVTRAYRHQ